MMGVREENPNNQHRTPSRPQMRRDSLSSLYRQYYSRIADKKVVFEFTRAVDYLHQYGLLRSRLHGKVVAPIQGDPLDRHSHILVMRKDNLVVGGARLTIKTPRSRHLLPLEHNDFLLEKVFPDYDLAHTKYAELSGLVTLQEFASCVNNEKIAQHILRKVRSSGVRYVFIEASAPQARHFADMFAALGAHFTLAPITVPERDAHEGVTMHLMIHDSATTPDEYTQATAVVSQPEPENA